jgi:site-specific recombinase XerD
MWFRAWNRSEALRAVQRLARQAGVDGRISPHNLRTIATIALDNAVAPHDLHDSLGQAGPRTTRRYDRSRHMLAKTAATTSHGRWHRLGSPRSGTGQNPVGPVRVEFVCIRH